MGSSSKKDKSHRHDKESKRERKESKRVKTSKVVDDDADEWVEKPAAPPTGKGVEVIPTNESLHVHGNPSSSTREDWLGLGHKSTSATSGSSSKQFDPRTRGQGLAVEDDFTDGFGRGENGTASDPFGSLGTQSSSRQARLQRQTERDAERASKPQMSAREINKAAFGGSEGAAAAAPAKKPKVEYGGAGSSWRMTKLKRVFEAAEDEGRPVEEVGLERYGTQEAWDEALAERRFLDQGQPNPQLASSVTQPGPTVDQFGREVRSHDRDATSAPQASTSANPATRFLFNQTANPASDFSRPSSRQSFKRPGESPAPGASAASSRFNSPKPSTPIPSVITPTIRPSTLSRANTGEDDEDGPAPAQSLSPTSLNRLQAKVLKAKLMDPDSEETRELQEQYDRALAAHHEGESSAEVRVLPSLDGRGQLYDLGGASAAAEAAERAQLSKRQKRKRDEQFESRDAQGNLVRYNADDDQQSLADLVRAEKFGGGPAEDKDLNKQLAGRIARDSSFQNDLEYMDDAAEKLGRKKARDEDRKRLWAVQGQPSELFTLNHTKFTDRNNEPTYTDYARTQKALDACWFCHQENSDPKVPVVAMGTRAYLALNRFEGLSDGHCLIVPVSHHLSSLEADEDTWEEIKVGPSTSLFELKPL